MRGADVFHFADVIVFPPETVMGGVVCSALATDDPQWGYWFRKLLEKRHDCRM